MKIKQLVNRIREYCRECCDRGQMAITLWKTKRREKRLNKQLTKLYESQKRAEEAFKRLQLWSEGGDPYGD